MNVRRTKRYLPAPVGTCQTGMHDFVTLVTRPWYLWWQVRAWKHCITCGHRERIEIVDSRNWYGI